MAISSNVKDQAFSRLSNPVSVYQPIAATDFGDLAPGAVGTAFSAGANLTASASGGSLATSTGAFKITWVDAQGESSPSVEATVAVTGATGSVTVALASIGGLNVSSQAGSQPILGWNIYSGNGSTNELKNTGTNSDLSVAVLSSITLADGTALTYIPIATTSVVVKVYGNGAAPSLSDRSGIQRALPLVAASSSADYYIFVRSEFSVSRRVLYVRPNEVIDPTGISIIDATCIAPLWAASNAYNVGDLIVVAGAVFEATVAGTSAALAAVPNFAGSVKNGLVVDNGATWKNRGRGKLVRLRFLNSSATAAQPVAQGINLYQ